MKVLGKVFLYYCLILSSFIFFSSTSSIKLVFAPVVLYFGIKALGKVLRNKNYVQFFTNRLFLYYNFIIVTILVVGGFLGARSSIELIVAAAFLPIAFYFGEKVLPRKKQALNFAETILPEPLPPRRHLPGAQVLTPSSSLPKVDKDRRIFIKLIGSAGLSLFIFSIFTKKAHAAFFGSVPGPGTVAVKDTAGNQIDPSQKQPTDGYKISEVDDSSPAFYGFIDKDGAWFIMKEDSSGAYRYTKGSSSFSTNWTSRTSLTYDYFHNVF